MRVVLIVIAAFALFGAVFLFPTAGGAVAISCIAVFVVAGTGAAVLEYLIDLLREAKRQTSLLEEMVRLARPPQTPVEKKPASSVRISGIN